MNIEALNKAMETLKSDLGDSLISSDMWIKGTGQSVVSFNENPKGVALFDQIMSNIEEALKVSDWPKMGKYFMTRLENNAFFIIIFVGDLDWGVAVDGNKVQLGLLLNVALPNALKAIEEI